MRRVAPFLLLAFVLAGCGGKQIVSPTAETVVGTVAAEKQQAAGDAKAGATLLAPTSLHRSAKGRRAREVDAVRERHSIIRAR